jgi:prepilin-type N-terminal cleavage/methylation domain-containing protein
LIRPEESGRYERGGFTLVELLVVVALILILITITVVSIDYGFNSERIRSGARQLQSALEGARDRAIFAKEPRGLRLLVDPTEPRMVSSLIYIGASKSWSKGQIRLERMDFEEDTNGNGQLDSGEDTNSNGRLDGNGIADGPEVLIVRGDSGCGWSTLKDRGYLGVYEDLNFNRQLDPGEDQNGNGLLDLDAPRIKIPADDNGSWYTVLSHRLTPTSQVLQLVTPYRDPGTTPPTEVIAFQGTGPNTYILELPPRILPDAQPILLPEGVVIDLDASDIPFEWRPTRGEDANGNGLLDSGEDTNGNGVLNVGTYSGHMDIMFSPRGVITGSLAARGLLHLYLGETKDVVKTVDLGVWTSSGAASRRFPRYADVSTPLVPGGGSPGAYGTFGPEEGEIGQRLLTTIFTQTGKVSTHPVNAVDSDGDGFADAPFLFATQGEGQAQ